MAEKINAADVTVGVVGLGLMGSSIIVSLLLAGHGVVAIAPIAGEKEVAPHRIAQQLKLCESDGLLSLPKEAYLALLTVSDNYALLDHCDLILECVVEKIEVKNAVYQKIVSASCPDTIIASNTSAIPISLLQQMVTFPERFIGIHWAEPAFATRFMEIVCGEQTSQATADRTRALALSWGKEPTLLKKDIRGFITNRLMYAVYREAFSLVEEHVATMADVDKSFRYDEGSWMTLMGLFRRMDFMGLKDYVAIFETLFPLLSNSGKVPDVMEQLVADRAGGTQDLKGLYRYTTQDARRWEEAFARFTRDIYELASQYPAPLKSTVKEI
jgi:3-hydroxybutyryl-CoA dehydrogenase